MKKELLFVITLLSGVSVFQTAAQCPGCIVSASLCDSTGSDGQVCVSALPDGEAGTAYETEVTFKFPRRFTIQQGDTIPGTGFIFPAIPQFPQVVIMDILGVTLDSIGGLPSGLQWECDSTGCSYTPGLNAQHGCVKICGTIGCDAVNPVNVIFHFTYIMDGQDFLDAVTGGIPFPFPIPTQLPSASPYTVPFEVITAGASTLDITPDKPTVIGLGETITLTATSGFSEYNWSTGDTGMTVTITPTESAFITVIATDANGCSKESTISITVLGSTGIDSGNPDELIRIHPNPGNGEFTITANYAYESLRVIDLRGKEIYHETLLEQALSPMRISLSHLEKGIYFLELSDGTKKSFKKIIIN